MVVYIYIIYIYIKNRRKNIFKLSSARVNNFVNSDLFWKILGFRISESCRAIKINDTVYDTFLFVSLTQWCPVTNQTITLKHFGKDSATRSNFPRKLTFRAFVQFFEDCNRTASFVHFSCKPFWAETLCLFSLLLLVRDPYENQTMKTLQVKQSRNCSSHQTILKLALYFF